MIHAVDTSFLVAAELASHSRHAAARQLLQSLHQAGDQFALAPQVLAEFVHIVTDPRRCTNPLMIDEALDRADDPLALFLTWTTYGSWLSGDERGWVEKPGCFREPDVASV
jgi:predicted nucleic acid-binding protein